MAYHRLCESDYRFLSLIWDHEPVNSTELVRLAAEELGWKKSTVYTMVKKLAEKDLVANENATVRSLVPREEIQMQESRSFVDQTFSGSLPGFLVSFYGGRGISPEEAQELQKLIDELKQEEE
jgi:predicted transcriptional regulator